MASWETELQKAVDKNDLVAVKAILAREEVRKNGNLGRKEWMDEVRPLHYAAWCGMSEMVQAMAEAGIDVNSYRGFGDDKNCKVTALHNAVWNNKGDTVRLLLDLGADLSLKGQWGDAYALGTPLEWTGQKEGHEVVARILQEYRGKPPSSLTSFETMDSKDKLMQKSQKVLELEEANKLRSEIEEKKEEVMKLEEDIEKEKEKMTKEEIKLKALKDELKSLEAQPSFRFRDVLEKQVEEIEALEKSLKEVLKVKEDKKEACPVCFVLPKQVFTCQECDSWVCQECRGQLVTCPTCRLDLTAKELRRSRVAEKILGIA